MSLVHPFRLLGRRALAACEDAVLSGARAWAGHWLPEAPELRILQVEAAAASASGPAPDQWTLLFHADPHNWAAAFMSAADRLWLSSYATGSLAAAGDFGGQQGELGEHLLETMLADLARGILPPGMMPQGHDPKRGLSGEFTADLVDQLSRTGSGGALIDLAIQGRRLSLGLSSGTVEHLSGPGPAPSRRGNLVPRGATLGKQKLSLRLAVGSASITVSELQSLAPGNVIRLDNSINETLRLQRPDGSVACHAHLGRSGDFFACQLTK